jgi:hypothetical protein
MVSSTAGKKKSKGGDCFGFTTMGGLSPGAARATAAGVLIDIPAMLLPVKICLKTQPGFK